MNGQAVRKWTIACAIMALLAFAATAADESLPERAKHEEARACVQCHSLRLIHSQRLSRAAWTKEMDKMIGWGAPVKERELLIDYYAQEYSDAKPVPIPERSGDAHSALHN
jgi:mono/diheme cytochrome c family protein